MKPTKSRKKLNPSKSNTDYMNQVQKDHEVRRIAFNKSYFGGLLAEQRKHISGM